MNYSPFCTDECGWQTHQTCQASLPHWLTLAIMHNNLDICSGSSNDKPSAYCTRYITRALKWSDLKKKESCASSHIATCSQPTTIQKMSHYLLLTHIQPNAYMYTIMATSTLHSAHFKKNNMKFNQPLMWTMHALSIPSVVSSPSSAILLLLLGNGSWKGNI